LAGFVQKGKRELKDGLRIVRPAVIVMDPKAIARRYLRTSFAIDFISSVPWDFLLFVPSVKKRYWVLQVRDQSPKDDYPLFSVTSLTWRLPGGKRFCLLMTSYRFLGTVCCYCRQSKVLLGTPQVDEYPHE
jgi:hypothetical protein